MDSNKKSHRVSKTAAEQKTKMRSTPISAEFVTDTDSGSSSSDESDSSSRHNLKRKASEISGSGKATGGSGKKVQDHKARLTDSSSSDSEKDSVTSDSDGTNHVTKQPRDPKSSSVSIDNTQNGVAHEDEDEDSETGSESDTSSGSIANPGVPHGQAEVVIVPLNTDEATTLGSFQPPEGYSTPSINIATTTNIRDLFCRENLNGKEIWHFTVPDGLSIGDIQNFTTTDMTERKAVLRHQDTDYGFTVGSGMGTTSKVFVPRAGGKYEPVALPIHQTLHLRRITNIPSISSRPISETPTTNTIPGARKAALKQPKGLKLGYPMIGDIEPDENRENTVKQAKQRVENSKIQSLAEPMSKSKKSKKKNTSSSNPVETTEWVDPESYNAPVVVGSASQHTIEFPAESNPSMDTTMLDETESRPRVEDAEVKARRKAEKAAKREARKARKAAAGAGA